MWRAGREESKSLNGPEPKLGLLWGQEKSNVGLHTGRRQRHDGFILGPLFPISDSHCS